MHANRVRTQGPRQSAALYLLLVQLGLKKGLCIFFADLSHESISSGWLWRNIRSIGKEVADIRRKLKVGQTNRMEDRGEVIRQGAAQHASEVQNVYRSPRSKIRLVGHKTSATLERWAIYDPFFFPVIVY